MDKKEQNKFNLNKTLINSIIVLCCLIVICYTCFYKTNINNKNNSVQSGQITKQIISEYKSIVPVSFENKNVLDSLNLINQQESDLKEFFSQNHSQEEYNSIFLTFYKNLLKFTDRKNCMLYVVSDILYYKDEKGIKSNDILAFNDENNKNIKGLKFQVKLVDKDDIVNFKIYQPKTDILTLAFLEEEFYETVIDYEYIDKVYSVKLSNEWQEYLKLKAQEYKDNNGISLSQNIDIITNLLINESNFINQHPNFIMNDFIKNTIKDYLFGCMLESNIVFDCKDDYSCDYNILMPKAKKAYEKFLNNINKNTAEYVVINNIYEYLKNNDFIVPSDITDIIDSLQTNFFYIDEIIQKFSNLKFDKQDIYNKYKKANSYCLQHINDTDKNGVPINAGTGYLESCIKEKFEEKGKDYSNIYNTIWDYCTAITVETQGMAGIRNCLHQKFEEMK